MMILFLFLFSISSSHIITCNHDDFQRHLHPALLKSSHRLLSWSDPTSGSPIRITFDLTYIETPDPSLTCTSVGQIISWGGNSYSCVSADLFSTSQQESVIGTITNLNSFISSLLSVPPIETLTSEPSFTLISNPSSGYPVSQSRTDGHTDFYMTVYPRPFGANS
jgi:hypothetical protein